MIKKILLSLQVILLSWPALSGADLESLKGRVYGRVEVQGSTFISESRIKDFIELKSGTLFSYIEVSHTLKKLFRLGLYEDIIIEYDLDREFINVNIRLFEKKRIKKLLITGKELPYKRKRLMEIMNLYEGKLVSVSDIDFAVKKLESFLDIQGVVTSGVKFRLNNFGEGLILVIYPGDISYQRISRIILKGVNENIDKASRSIRKNMSGKIISERTVNDAEYAVSSLLLSRGYRESRVLSLEITDAGENKADLTFNIALNDRFALDIKGNRGFSEDTIIENIPQIIDFINNPDETDFIENMLERFYTERGYFMADARVSVKEMKKDFFVLYIDISEGRRYRVRDLFVKVDGIVNRELNQYLSLAPVGLSSYPLYDRQKLDKDIETLKSYYTDRGYPDAEISYDFIFIDNINQLILDFTINKNSLYTLGEITVRGDISPDNNSFYKDLKDKYENKPYRPAVISDIMDAVYHYYLTRGYVDFEANATVHDSEYCTKNIEFEINEGEPYFIRNIIFAGDLDINEDILRKNFNLSRGLPYDTRLLFILRQNLYNTGYFRRVFIEEYDFYSSMFYKDFILHLEEADSGNAFFSIGYDSKERLRTQTELSYLNITGYGTDLSVGLKFSSVEERYNIRLNNRYLINETNVILDIFKESLERSIKNEEINGASITLSRVFRDTSFKVDFGYEYKNIKSFEMDFKSSVIGGLSATMIYDSRDNILFPSSGTFVLGNIKYADEIFYSEHNFLRAFLKATKYFPFYRNVFVLSLQSGFNFPLYGDDKVPYSERYFLGGRLTMRGFERNSISPNFFGEPFGGNSMYLMNAELRIDIAYGFGLTLFFDAGNVWGDYRDYNIGDLRKDAGFGIYYNTPFGPVRFDMGFKISPETGERESEYFLNFGHPF